MFSAGGLSTGLREEGGEGGGGGGWRGRATTDATVARPVVGATDAAEGARSWEWRETQNVRV